MALTRKMLTAMGLEAEKIDEIIDEHSKTVNAIKEERDALKTELETAKGNADKLKELEKELEKVKAELEAADVEGLNKKYTDIKTEYDAYKKDVEAKATHTAKSDAYRQLLLDAGISEKRLASILKVSDVDAIELDSEGKVKDAEKLSESIKTEWADFIQTGGQQGANVSNPPDNTGGSTFEKMNLQEKMIYANEHPDEADVKTWLGRS